MFGMPFDGIVTKAVTEELQQQLQSGKITKIYQPTATELLFTVRSKGKNHSLLFSIHPTYARIHRTNDSYQNPETPPMFCMILRKYLSGAIIETIEQYHLERIVTLTLKTRNEIGDWSQQKLIIELMGKHSNIMLVDPEKGHIINSMKHVSAAKNSFRTILPGSKYILPPSQNKVNPLDISSEDFLKKLDFNAGKLDMQMVSILEGVSPAIAKELVSRTNLGSSQAYMEMFAAFQQELQKGLYKPAIYRSQKEDFHVLHLTGYQGEVVPFPTVSDMLDAYFSGKAERDRVKQQAKDLYRLIKTERDKNERKLQKHRQTIKKAENADKYQKIGELLTAHMHLASKGDTVIKAVDYYDPEQKEIEIKLNPNKTPSENAQDYFKTYQKMKTSKIIVEEEIKKTNMEIAYLDQLLQQIDVASETDIEEIRDELREEGYLKKQRTSKKIKQKNQPTPEVFQASDGTTILVGKNNKQNEYLTTRIANRGDLWLHTKDIPGSHVVIRSQNPSDETILEAAQLAAYFSKSQHSSAVPVDYTEIRHVKKPKGAKPGFVTYDHQKTVFVTPNKEVVERLKAKP